MPPLLKIIRRNCIINPDKIFYFILKQGMGQIPLAFLSVHPMIPAVFISIFPKDITQLPT